MEIQGTIREFDLYKVLFQPKNLSEYTLSDIETGNALNENSLMLKMDGSRYATSIWTGPKRSRTYPYKHVYDTMRFNPRVTLIPFVKDEGIDGDRDYIQWDTISLMTLLGIYVIITYHASAEKSTKKRVVAQGKQKVDNHQLDTTYVLERLAELRDYKSDPFHWNQRELDIYLPLAAERAKKHYPIIENQTGVTLNSIEGLDRKLEKLENYREESRKISGTAQSSEAKSIQPNEVLGQGEKASINIINQYNGVYQFTVDEVLIRNTDIFLIEKKHSRSTMPSNSDIKDGLLKLMLYHNIDDATVGNKTLSPFPVLGLTADKISGVCHSRMTNEEILTFFDTNNLSATYRDRIEQLFQEAQTNNFLAYLVHPSEENEFQNQIVSRFGSS